MNEIVLANQLTEAEDLPAPTRDEVAAALDILRRHGALALDDDLLTEAARGDSRNLNRSYPEDFVPDAAYKAGMPDLQNGPSSLIKGAKTEIQHVGVSNFRLPLTWQTRAGGELLLETSVTGSVSLEASKKGINMSRILRSFYKHADEPFDIGRINRVLESYQDDLESFDARLQLSIRYPMLKRSLRSDLDGYQYYEVAFEVVRQGPQTISIIHLDYVYSSTCPCSLELSEHARTTRGQIATPHSQRSVARISAVIENDEPLWTEDLVELCVAAIPTETQVMVKREDEQAFAELNGSNPIFVEDAVRLICDGLERESRVGDFRVVASHQESLHSHDAVSILTSGPTFRQVSYDQRMFASLYHVG
ncbi:GTP cyclohydrolase FolE2 [Hoeflea prorocentri]|uniref:GTP cyclohydrolase FolE2 n=1 Tax=Hoeflea prorocentri TaxID=1922333 RepID=A0A9X3UJX0_9HYPH|nr:GTP cyclohydrolase FolE2 [Hoeflea prorocentri]MCY6382208.1 GTP cyclohydrolase FolE2 [Hoeflea prorocentri]MDA5400008.1 GTP cyclohydrolase FolE2 [Hoeflea prorocentri]